MSSLFPLLFGVIAILILSSVSLLLLRLLHKDWWQIRRLRLTALLLPLLGVLAIVGWGMGEYYRIGWISMPCSLFSILVLVLELALMISLPLSGTIRLIDKGIDWFGRRNGTRKLDGEEGLDPRRRVFLKGAAAAVPLLALSAGVSGVGRALGGVNVEKKQFVYADLPPDLHGLTIAHLSDLHIWHYMTLNDVETAVASVAEYKPDLVLVTGDVADDLSQLPGALKMFSSLNPRLGTYAILGNHEYFRGIQQVRRIYDQSPVPLLVNQGVRIPVGGTSLYLAGLDDPRHMHELPPEFFQQAIAQSLADRRTGEFALLMSHRPNAFTYAAESDIQLTLAGHTHGGQIGIGGRSLFESGNSTSFLWGKYVLGTSQLYTSSGMGHWFPFRLGCPQEAPIIELIRG